MYASVLVWSEKLSDQAWRDVLFFPYCIHTLFSRYADALFDPSLWIVLYYSARDTRITRWLKESDVNLLKARSVRLGSSTGTKMC